MSNSAFRLGLTIVGAVVGSFFGQPQLGFIIGAGLGYALFPPEGKTVIGRQLDDLKVSFSSYGKPIPRIYGTMEIGGNVVWSPGLVEHRIEEEVGGKGGGGTTVVSFLYTASFRINYAVGPAQAILRNWADGKLIAEIVDFDPLALGPIPSLAFAILGEFDDSPGNQALRNFLGTTTQLPGPAEQADKGLANTPAYRGTVGQEWEDLPLEDYGNRIPQISAEIAMVATETFPIKILSGNQGTGTSWEWQAGVEFLITNNVVRFNNITQDKINSSSLLSQPSWMSPDAQGRLYRAQDGFGASIAQVLQYNGSTFQLLVTGTEMKNPFTGAVITSSLNWTGSRIFGGLALPDGTVGGELLYMLRQTTATIAIVNISSLLGETGGVVNFFSAPNTPTEGETVDAERHLWIFANSAGDTILYRLEPATGDIVETHTISGVVTSQNCISYEPTTNSIILAEMTGSAGTSSMRRWDIDTEIVEAEITGISLSNSSGANSSMFRNGPSHSGRMYLQSSNSSGNFTEYDVINMIAGKSWSLSADYGLDASQWSWGVYDPLHHAVIKRQSPGGLVAWLFLDRATGDDITVRSIVEDVSSLVDYVAGTDIDATELTDTLPGYVVRSQMTARRALEPLATAFNFRSVESDFKIKFPKRGGASVGNIPQIDLGATAGEVPTTQALTKTRITEDQLFETAIIEYIDPTFDNNPNTQQAKRSKEAIDVGGVLKFDFPGALGNDQAAQIIERILFQAWSGRTNVATALPLKHILKDPGDVVTITKDNKTVTVELHDVRLGANSLIKIDGTIDDSVVHVSTATGVNALGVETQVVELAGPTEFFIMDISLLRDLDNGNGIYVAAGTPGSTTWPGAAIRRGPAIGELGPFTALSSSRDADYGFTTDALADASPDIFDRDNTVNVKLFSGTLSSSTETLVLGEVNAILIGREIIQFVNATLEADGSYTLDTLLRGRRGSEQFTSTHAIGDDVVLLSATTVLRVGVDLSNHLTNFFYKAITLGSSTLSTKTVEEVLTLRSQMPYAPSHIAGSISGNDWTFTGIWRTRIGGTWKDSIEAPLGETTESWEWDVMNGSTVVRTLTSATGSVTYISADQITDFGGNQTTLELNVYEISADVARGFATNVTLVGG